MAILRRSRILCAAIAGGNEGCGANSGKSLAHIVPVLVTRARIVRISFRHREHIMVTKWLARCVLAGATATIVMALATDASFAAKKRAMGPVPPGACKVSGGYIPSGQACTSAPNQFNVSHINWCSFGNLTPGIYCAGALCPAAKC
jgi:hypothetical protein